MSQCDKLGNSVGAHVHLCVSTRLKPGKLDFRSSRKTGNMSRFQEGHIWSQQPSLPSPFFSWCWWWCWWCWRGQFLRHSFTHGSNGEATAQCLAANASSSDMYSPSTLLLAGSDVRVCIKEVGVIAGSQAHDLLSR